MNNAKHTYPYANVRPARVRYFSIEVSLSATFSYIYVIQFVSIFSSYNSFKGAVNVKETCVLRFGTFTHESKLPRTIIKTSNII